MNAPLRPDLVAAIEAAIPDNTTGAIKPRHLRQRLLALVGAMVLGDELDATLDGFVSEAAFAQAVDGLTAAIGERASASALVGLAASVADKADLAHTHTIGQIEDVTATGRALVRAGSIDAFKSLLTLAAVASSGRYVDLLDRPTIPTSTNQLANGAGFITSADPALAAKAPLASPAFTGAPTAPTAAAGSSGTTLATTAFVANAIQALTGLAPADLDTLNEIAARLVSNENTDAALVGIVAGKLAKSANLSDLLDAGAARTNLGLVIGTHVQAFDADLAAIAALATTTFGRGLLALTDLPALKALLALAVGDVSGLQAALDAKAVASFATAADIWAASDAAKIVTAKVLHDAMLPQTLTPGATVTPNAAGGINFSLAPNSGQAFTLANFTNVAANMVGRTGSIRILVPSGGMPSITLGGAFKNVGATAVTPSTTAGVTDAIEYRIAGTSRVEFAYNKGFAA